jgi:hypothetical protein
MGEVMYWKGRFSMISHKHIVEMRQWKMKPMAAYLSANTFLLYNEVM